MSHQIQTKLHNSLLDYANEGQRVQQKKPMRYICSMSGDVAQAQLLGKGVYGLKKRFVVRYNLA